MSNVLEHIKDRHEFLMKCKVHAPKLLIRVPAFERDWLVPYKKSLGLEWKLHNDHYIEHTVEELMREIMLPLGLFLIWIVNGEIIIV